MKGDLWKSPAVAGGALVLRPSWTLCRRTPTGFLLDGVDTSGVRGRKALAAVVFILKMRTRKF